MHPSQHRSERRTTDAKSARQIQDLAAEDGRRHWPGQAGLLLRFVIHVAFYGFVVWWALGKPEIPIRWLQ